MRGGNARNTGVSRHFGSVQPVTLAWQDAPESPPDWFYKLTIPPVVGPDGTIYAGADYTGPYSGNGCDGACWRGELRAINPDGTLKWSRLLPKGSAGQWFRNARRLLVGPNGNIYVGWAFQWEQTRTRSVAFFAFDPDGNLLWAYEPLISHGTSSQDGPIMGADGTIYVALASKQLTPDGDLRASLIALDSATGQPNWQFVSEREDSFPAGPALGLNGKLYYVSSGFGSIRPGTLYCLDSATGELVWENIGVSSQITPVVDADGSVFIVNYPSTSWCTKFDEYGNELWRHDTGAGTTIKFASLHAGKLFLSQGSSGGVTVLDASTAQRVEKLAYPALNIGRVTIDSAGNRYVMMDAALVAYSPAGELLWVNTDPCCSGVLTTPVIIGHDGMILQRASLVGQLDVLGAYKPLGIAPIPTVSEWGLIVMTLLALTAGTVLFGRRRRAAAP